MGDKLRLHYSRVIDYTVIVVKVVFLLLHVYALLCCDDGLFERDTAVYNLISYRSDLA